MESEREESKTRKTGLSRKMYWVAAIIPPVSVFLSTERLRTRIVSVVLTLLWVFGLLVLVRGSQAESDMGAVVGIVLMLPSIIHAVLTVREAKRREG